MELAHVVVLPLEVAEPLGLAYHALTHCYVHRHSLPALWRGKCSISKIGLFVNRGRKLNTKLDLAQLSEIAVGHVEIFFFQKTYSFTLSA